MVETFFLYILCINANVLLKKSGELFFAFYILS